MTNGLLCIGDNVVDLYLDRGVFFPGGNALNVAVLARRFGLSDVAYKGIVGNDREGDHVRACMVAEGLSIAHLSRVEGPNGKAQVTHDAYGDRVFVSSNRGGIRRKLMLRMDEDDLTLIAATGHVHSSCFSYLEPELPRIRAAARAVSFDFSTLHDPAYLAQVCPHVTTAFLSGAGLDDPTVADLITRVLDLGPDIVCVTLGEKGAVWAKGQTRIEQPIVPTTVVDTMGAGDAFIAGYLVGALRGDTVEQVLSYAASCAAKACGWEGAWGYPLADNP
ncbi:MAG TPA: PfkB family carbohydrate kinase [Albidovulum sp.]|uniref:PfkB family carbohydrate kinase n=1 Tax=Albidovulum sp. TaxID=1872424 RepID=UPI002CD49648|nr:PfkB family carbohydrate kinase [Albidovulum sp.]